MNSSTTGSIPDSTCAKLVGLRLVSADCAHHASSSPPAPPAAASTSDSIRNCRTIRPRLAPSARRTAISFRRARCASEEQAGNVGARNRQHERDGSPQDQQRLPEVAEELRAQRNDHGAARAVCVRVQLTDTCCDHVRLPLCLLEGDAVFEPPDGPKVLRVPVGGKVLIGAIARSASAHRRSILESTVAAR